MNSKLKSAIINIVLLAVVVFLAFKLVQSIQAPIKFNNEKAAREAQVVQNLKDLRDLEIQFKQANNKYTASFDTLLAFCETGVIPIVKIVPDPADTTFTKTINDTLGFVKVIDSLFGNRQNFRLQDLKNVPFSNPLEQFEIQAGSIKRGGIDVSVFEIKTPYKVYLNGLDEQRVRNASAEQEQIDKYPGMRVGSMEEASTDGNWEKL